MPGWQVVLAIAMGRAADNDELLLQPYELLELMPLLAELWREGAGRGLTMIPGNTMGYYGPYETLFRAAGNERIHWVGCNAGLNSIGIESDGTIKGCPSLPRTPYAGGNIRDRSLEDLWNHSPEIGFNRTRTVEDLWGFCRTCYYADVCRGGCTWTSHSLFGLAGNNPYCHHRAVELAKQGLRERVVKVEPAPGIPFDHGRFDLLLEPLDGGGESVVCAPPASAVAPEAATPQLYQIGRVRELPPRMGVCRNCNSHVRTGAQNCPHCGADLDAAEHAYAEKLARARAALERLAQSFARLESSLDPPAPPHS